MKLHEDWKWIVKNAWSFRLMILTGLLSGIEVILPLFQDVIPRGVFAVAALVTAILANGARVIQQMRLNKEDKKDGD